MSFAEKSNEKEAKRYKIPLPEIKVLKDNSPEWRDIDKDKTAYLLEVCDRYGDPSSRYAHMNAYLHLCVQDASWHAKRYWMTSALSRVSEIVEPIAQLRIPPHITTLFIHNHSQVYDVGQLIHYAYLLNYHRGNRYAVDRMDEGVNYWNRDYRELFLNLLAAAFKARYDAKIDGDEPY